MEVFSWLLVLSIILYYFWKRGRPKELPPGPRPLPFFGNVFQLGFRNPLTYLQKLTKQYGPVFSLYAGRKPIIFIQDWRLAKEVLLTKGIEFAGRQNNPIIDLIQKKKGIIMAPYGQAWKEQRRFSLMVLRNFGLGKKSMEERILAEAAHLIQAFTENMINFSNLQFPNEQKPEKKGLSFDDENLLIVVSDLFIAGSETTARTLQWGLLYMMAYPEIQEKCQQEMDAVLGNNACLKYEDRERLPYTNAVIHEILRFSSVVPLGVEHAPIKDMMLSGYVIPKAQGFA
nr:cytochrome P450 2J6-like [Pogona vitticeps]